MLSQTRVRACSAALSAVETSLDTAAENIGVDNRRRRTGRDHLSCVSHDLSFGWVGGQLQPHGRVTWIFGPLHKHSVGGNTEPLRQRTEAISVGAAAAAGVDASFA